MFVLKRNGTIVGEIHSADNDAVLAWWVEDEGETRGQIYSIRASTAVIEIRADQYRSAEYGSVRKQVFTLGEQTVGTIYGLAEPFTWWIG